MNRDEYDEIVRLARKHIDHTARLGRWLCPLCGSRRWTVMGLEAPTVYGMTGLPVGQGLLRVSLACTQCGYIASVLWSKVLEEVG